MQRRYASIARYLVRTGSEVIITDQVCLARGAEGGCVCSNLAFPGGAVHEAMNAHGTATTAKGGAGRGREALLDEPHGDAVSTHLVGEPSIALRSGQVHQVCRGTSSPHKDVDGHARPLPTRCNRPASWGSTVPRPAMHTTPLSPAPHSSRNHQLPNAPLLLAAVSTSAFAP